MASGPSVLRDQDQAFIDRQRLFFVATAAPDGRVNLSPKGLDSLRVLSPVRIVWLSLSGSGNETAAHLLESDRMTLMFCSFEGRAGILRVYGRARAVYPHDNDWAQLRPLFPPMAGARQIFDLAVDLVTTSCGTGIPVFVLERERGSTELLPFFEAMDQTRLQVYWEQKNRISLDGKPTGLVKA